MLIMVVFIVCCFVLNHWSWKRGFEAGKIFVQKSRREQQSLDSQKNVYGRIVNALTPMCITKYMRGVQITPLGLKDDGVYYISVFWKNEFHSLGILSIEVRRDSILVESLTAPCPQGKKRRYTRASLNNESILLVILDLKNFISETYEVAYRVTVAGSH